MSEDINDENTSEYEEGQELDGINETDSSTVEEVTKLKEENERLKSHLRNKEEKKKSATQSISPEDLETLREVQAKLKQQEESAKEIAFNQTLQEDWGQRYSSDQDPDGDNVAELNKALSLVNQKYPVLTAEDYKRNLRKAHLMIAEEQQQEPSQDVTAIKQDASGMSGSTSRSTDVNLEAQFGKLSQSDQEVLTRVNARRKQRGQEPLKLSDIK